MNYENFSPEAQKAIEHIRNFCTKSKIWEIGCCDCNEQFCTKSFLVKEKSDSRSFWEYGYSMNNILHRVILSFDLSCKEIDEILSFAESKNYWQKV